MLDKKIVKMDGFYNLFMDVIIIIIIMGSYLGLLCNNCVYFKNDEYRKYVLVF